MGMFSNIFGLLKSRPASVPSRIGSEAQTRAQAETRAKRIGQPTRGSPAVQPSRLERIARNQSIQQEEAAKREAKSDESRRSDPLYRFVHLGEKVATPQSSNVAAIQYDKDASQLHVWYDDGSLYAYYNVDPGEAASFYQAGSKGSWTWDNLRIRGTKLGARKEYTMIQAGSRGRKWEATHRAAKTHSEKVAKDSGQKGAYEKLGKFARTAPKRNTGRR